MTIGELSPCSYCRKATQHATLAQYGARCFDCWEAFKLQAMPEQPKLLMTHAEKIAALQKLRTVANSQASRQWAHVLAHDEAHGRPLTLAQRQMWRRGLGVEDFAVQ
jgi:hypothetical protein